MKKTLSIILAVAAVLSLGFSPAGARRPAGKPSGGQGADTQSVFTMPTPPQEYSDSLTAAFYYTEGVKRLYIYDDRENAAALFDRAIEADPGHAPSFYERANTLMDSNPAKALEYSLRANAADSSERWYKSQLGRLQVSTGRYAEARKTYEGLIAASPRNPENYSMLAALYEVDGQALTAISILDRAEQVAGRFEQLAEHKRELLIRQGLYDRAIEEGKALTASYPHNYESWLSLAQLYAETGNDSLAVESFNHALTLNPEGADILVAMNEYYKVKGDDPKYLSTARRLINSPEVPLAVKEKWLREVMANNKFFGNNYFQIKDMAALLYAAHPDNYDVLSLFARTLVVWGDVEGAVEYHKGYLSDTVSVVTPYLDIIEMEAYLGRQDSVRKYTEMAVRRFPADAELQMHYGAALNYMKDHKGALKAYERALAASQTDSARSVAYGIIGDHHHQQNDDKKSFANYRKALQLWPDNASVLNNYAYYLSEREEDLDRAENMASRVMELEPSNPTYIDTYGWVLYKRGKYAEAKSAIRQAIALDTGNSAELLCHYGDILYALGEEYMASVYWKRALEAGYDATAIEKRLGIVE